MKLTKILVILTAFFCCNETIAQTTTTSVKGKVISETNNKPLQSATITLVGAKKGTATDAQGAFTIKLPDDTKQYKILVAYSGFASKEISVKAGDNITVKLADDVKDEGEVIIQTGYGGGIKKKELAASVSTVGAKDLKDIPISSVAEALNGRLGGVTATTSEGSPDAQVSVKVRGGISISQDNSPLYVIDGVVIEGGINNLVLQDIQDISVLKDAAATAIYGARGANGVIVITTKTGKPGKIKVSYNGYAGFKSLTKKLDVLSPYDFVMYQYERALIADDLASFQTTYGSTFDTLSAYKKTPVTDWQGAVLGNKGQTIQHNVSFSGGTKKTNYLFSYTNQKEDAIVLNSKYAKHQLNFKVEQKFGSKVKLGVSTRYTNQNVYGSGTSTDANSIAFGRLRNVVKFRPFLLAGETIDDASPEADIGGGLSLVNPVRLSNQEYRRKTTNAYNVTVSLTYNINKNWTFRSTAGFDRSLLEDKQFSDSISPATSTHNRFPVLDFDSTRKTSFSNSNVLTYSLKNYKKHHDFDFLLGEETNYIENRILQNEYELPHSVNKDTVFDNINKWGATQVALYPKRNTYRATILSFFTRLNYTLDKKYIFGFVLRADGTSKFTQDNRWGYFPSGSFAWRMSNEKFMDKVKFVNDVKFRLTYGTNGNARLDDYLYLNTFRQDQVYYGVGGVPVQGYSPTSLGNSNLLWESVLNKNIGLDFNIFNKKIDVSLDYYYNTSKNLLLNVPIASTYGYKTQIQNIGKTRASGVEVQINANILQSKKGLNWNANFNIAFNRNKILELRSDMKQFLPEEGNWNSTTLRRDYIERVGDPVGAFYGFITDGFYKASDFVSYTGYGSGSQTHDVLKPGVVDIKGNKYIKPGYIKYKDISSDKNNIVDVDNDRTVIGNPTPKFTGGLNQQFTYRNFDASVFINFSYGGDIYNANKIDFVSAYVPNANMLAITKNRWTNIDASGNIITDLAKLDEANKNATIWQPTTGSDGYYLHSFAIEDGSYLRINNITFGYSIPLKSLANIGISKFRFYVTGNNLAVFTKYSGYDPETSVRKSPLTPGLDYSAYPKSRSFIIGVNVIF